MYNTCSMYNRHHSMQQAMPTSTSRSLAECACILAMFVILLTLCDKFADRFCKALYWSVSWVVSLLPPPRVLLWICSSFEKPHNVISTVWYDCEFWLLSLSILRTTNHRGNRYSFSFLYFLFFPGLDCAGAGSESMHTLIKLLSIIKLSKNWECASCQNFS